MEDSLALEDEGPLCLRSTVLAEDLPSFTDLAFLDVAAVGGGEGDFLWSRAGGEAFFTSLLPLPDCSICLRA